MAIVTSGLIYYEKNTLRSLGNWNILSGATVSGDKINISSGGLAGIDLSNNYNNGLKASKYRRLKFSVIANFDVENNYENYIEAVVKCKFTDSDGNSLSGYYSINLTLLMSNISDGVCSIDRVISMEPYDLDSCTVYIINHTLSNIQLTSCDMRRSQDISGSQIGEAIGFSISLDKVVAYLDGCEIYYEGVEKPDKLWWMGDENDKFCGINVNNERMIKFSRINEILLD